MRRLSALLLSLGLLWLGAAGSSHAATLDFTGTLSLRMARFPAFTIPGAGTAQVTDDGSLHLLSFLLPEAAFGPVNMSIPLLSAAELQSVRLTGVQNLSGSFSGISGGSPGGGPMGLTGIHKLCMFGGGCFGAVSIPLSPTTGGAGFGLGGTQLVPGSFALTMRHAPWTVGQPVMTLHTPESTITTPSLPGGFAHGPASLTSSTAQPSGALQLVTVSKVFTSLTSAFPEFPMIGVVTLHFVPEPGTLLLLGSGVAALLAVARRRGRR